MEQFLRCVVGETPKKWLQVLPWAQWWYNSAYHTALKISPFKALYGYPPPTVTAYQPGSTANDMVDLQLRERDEIAAVIKRNLAKAQARMKLFYDKKNTVKGSSKWEIMCTVVPKAAAIQAAVNEQRSLP